MEQQVRRRCISRLGISDCLFVFDGTTYVNTGPNAEIYFFDVVTSGSGAITSASIVVAQWQSGTSPHRAGERAAFASVFTARGTFLVNNARLLSVPTLGEWETIFLGGLLVTFALALPASESR